MSLTPLNIHSDAAFSLCPIRIRADWPADATPVPGGGSFVMGFGEDPDDVYSGRFFPPLDIDIAPIAHSLVPSIPQPVPSGAPLITLVDADNLHRFRLSAHFEYSDYSDDVSLFVFPGAVPRQSLRTLHAAGSDPFDARFFNPAANFFLTSRSNSWRVVIRETELFPLTFITPSRFQMLTVSHVPSGTILFKNSVDPGIHALDFAAIRASAFADYDLLPSVFDVSTDAGTAARIIIAQAPPSAQRFRLLFRNSLGAFEIVEALGPASITPAFISPFAAPGAQASDTPEAFARFDPGVGAFSAARNRPAVAATITLSTGLKQPYEIPLILDLLASPEVHLLDFAPGPVQVIPAPNTATDDSLAFPIRPTAPLDFSLSLTPVDSDIAIAPFISGPDHASLPRIFSHQFSHQFN